MQTDPHGQDYEDTGSESRDAFELLKADHRQVQDLFTQFEDADSRRRNEIAEEVLTALETHTTIEEQAVYPAIREAVEKDEMMDEAREEHHVAKLLMKELRKLEVNDDTYPSKFKVLGEIIRHHVEEEEGEMFPQAEEAGLDTVELGRNVTILKDRLIHKREGKGAKKPASRRRKAA
jgi:hemerythrin superfamily protein